MRASAEIPPPARNADVAAQQAAFAAALLDTNRDVPEAVVAENEATRLKRFRVYRNNVYASLIEVLRARYPVIERLVGPEFFHAMARDFVERHPPRSRTLLEYGGMLPEFLEAFEPARDYPYFPDVARLEWLRNLAYHAADVGTASLGELSAIDPANLYQTRFVFHPSAHLIASPYPVVSIWAANTQDAEPRPEQLDLAGEAALVVRNELEVLVLPLDAGEYAFAEALAQGLVFGEAVEMVTSRHPNFDLSKALARLFSSSAISAIETFPSVEHDRDKKSAEAEAAA